jgi:hypothetical protein
MAVKIESYFQKADNGIGERYKSIALKVLRNLKVSILLYRRKDRVLAKFSKISILVPMNDLK